MIEIFPAVGDDDERKALVQVNNEDEIICCHCLNSTSSDGRCLIVCVFFF